MSEDLERLLEDGDDEVRLAAALALLSLGREDVAVPVLLSVAKARPDLVGRAAQGLPWLLPAKRRELFDQLVALPSAEEQLGELVPAMTVLPDEAAIEPLWTLLAGRAAPGRGSTIGVELAGSVYSALLELYIGPAYGFDQRLLPARRKAIAEVCRQKAQSGPPWQRLVALALLLSASRSDVAEVASQIVDEPSATEWLKRDAFQVLLLGLSDAEAQGRARDALASEIAGIRKVALVYVALGPEALRYLHGNRLYLYYESNAAAHFANERGKPIVPEAPKGLTAELVRPLLDDPDAETAAYAGYLLALLDEPEGLEVLLHYWRTTARDDPAWTRLVYRAIAYLDDEQLVPVLEEMYGRFDPDRTDLGDFYWTIRIMQGPRIVKLRKRIRDEVGMDRLR